MSWCENGDKSRIGILKNGRTTSGQWWMEGRTCKLALIHRHKTNKACKIHTIASAFHEGKLHVEGLFEVRGTPGPQTWPNWSNGSNWTYVSKAGASLETDQAQERGQDAAMCWHYKFCFFLPSPSPPPAYCQTSLLQWVMLFVPVVPVPGGRLWLSIKCHKQVLCCKMLYGTFWEVLWQQSTQSISASEE